MNPKCGFCGNEIDPDRDYRKVEGYERHRAQGGTNALALREVKDEWACWACVDKRKRGLAGQGALL